MSQPAAHTYALGLYDALTYLGPRGWLQADVTLHRLPSGALVLNTADFQVEAGVDDINLTDPEYYEAMVGEAVEYLAERLAEEGEDWTGRKLSVTRGDWGCQVNLRQDDDSIYASLGLGPAATQAVIRSPAFETMFAQWQDRLASRQQALNDALPDHDSWSYDEVSDSLWWKKNGQARLTRRAELLATYPKDEGTVLWPWGNDRLNAAPGAVTELRQQGSPDLPFLARDHCPASPVVARRLCELLSLLVGAQGAYAATFGEGTHYFAIFE